MALSKHGSTRSLMEKCEYAMLTTPLIMSML
ncbi:hypothetical protein QFZ32_000604 [Streptomyces canus]|uniref:Uncharacterized protein n=1 Tax=Streptomyces canus TaxID=58343 RepID=A0AAW8F3W0_9ACTN|nr:hypothetical protein [Streptomyces canus]MDQ1065165.1 hypothetical protein [Streptomyces canus]